MEPVDIHSESLSDQVFRFLQKEIVEGRLRPGARILEKELSTKLGISRTPIREALLKLQMAGIVVCLSRRSYNVRTLAVADVKETFEILGILEGAVVRSVAPELAESDLELLKEYNRKMAEQRNDGDFHAYGAWNERFHDVFISKYRNRSLRDLCDTVRRLLYTFPIRHDSLSEWIEKSVKEHEEIIRLAAAKDGPGLEAFFREVHWNQNSHSRFIEDAFAGMESISSRSGSAEEKYRERMLSTLSSSEVVVASEDRPNK